MLVYIAYPYTRPDPVKNTREAIKIADVLMGLGYTPYIPHLSMLWHMVCPHHDNFWYDYGLRMLEQCDCVLRMGGASPGADREVAHAEDKGIKVCYSLSELEVYFDRRS